MAKTALIIGASRGLGLGLAAEFAKRGWTVTATARDLATADGLTALAKAHANVGTEVVDIDDDASIHALAGRLKGEVYDLVFINPGVAGPRGPVWSASQEEARAVLYTNGVAPIRIAHALLDTVRRDTGVLAFMTSVLGSVAANTSGGMNLYRASKAALNTLTRSFVVEETKDRGLTVLSLHPGWVQTDMGGANAALDVATSVRGLADVVEKHAGSHRHEYLDYTGATIAW